MMKKRLILTLCLPTTAWAHGDHGNQFITALEHVFSSPEHVWPLTVGIVAVAYLLIKRRS